MPQSDGSKPLLLLLQNQLQDSVSKTISPGTPINLAEWKTEASVHETMGAINLWLDGQAAAVELGTTLPNTLMGPGSSWELTHHEQEEEYCAWWKSEMNNPTSWSLQDKWHFCAFWKARCLRSLQLFPNLSNPYTLPSKCCISSQNHIPETCSWRTNFQSPRDLRQYHSTNLVVVEDRMHVGHL